MVITLTIKDLQYVLQGTPVANLCCVYSTTVVRRSPPHGAGRGASNAHSSFKIRTAVSNYKEIFERRNGGGCNLAWFAVRLRLVSVLWFCTASAME